MSKNLILGIVAVLAILFGMSFYFLRRKKKHTETELNNVQNSVGSKELSIINDFIDDIIFRVGDTDDEFCFKKDKVGQTLETLMAEFFKHLQQGLETDWKELEIFLYDKKQIISCSENEHIVLDTKLNCIEILSNFYSLYKMQETCRFLSEFSHQELPDIDNMTVTEMKEWIEKKIKEADISALKAELAKKMASSKEEKKENYYVWIEDIIYRIIEKK